MTPTSANAGTRDSERPTATYDRCRQSAKQIDAANIKTQRKSGGRGQASAMNGFGWGKVERIEL